MPLAVKLPRLDVTWPRWMAAFVRARGPVFPSVEERARFVIELARTNVRRRTGGPFGAAVFEAASGRLVAPGVNRVERTGLSVAHAEIVALMAAQRILRRYDLGAPGLPACELVTSTEPCAMCLGAVPWSGVRRLVCAARGEDAEAIGMDEGAKPAGWVRELRARGIEVIRDVCRAEAAQVLTEYRDGGGAIYNGRGAGSG